MKTILSLVTGFLCVLVMTGCSPASAPTRVPATADAKGTETRIAAIIFGTLTAIVPAPSLTTTSTTTPTSTPTLTNIPTPIQTPTVTPTPTDTPIPSATPTPTETLAPTPSLTPTATRTRIPTPLPTPTFDIPADKRTYAQIDVRDLKKAADKYLGKRITVSGEVFNIKEDKSSTTIQVWSSYPGATQFDRIAVIVQYFGSLPGLYEKDTAVVYGLGGGTLDFQNLYGGTVTQPYILAKYVDYGN